MKIEHCKGFSFMPYAQAIEDGLQPVVIKEDELVSDVKAEDSLLSIVYARDARTGLPIGDLTYFVSDKANPEVKQFILDNLMRDVSAAANPTIPKGMDDDLAFELMRKSDETHEQYVQRLQDYKVQNELIVKNAIDFVPKNEQTASLDAE